MGNLKKIKFQGYEEEVSESYLEQELFDISFGCDMLIQFARQGDRIFAVNGVDGYGRNIRDEIYNKELVIE